MTELIWPPPKHILERDRQLAFEAWGERTRWHENFFSNFRPYVIPAKKWNLEFITAEHLYQAAKSDEPGYKEAIAKCEKPNKTKFLGRKCALRPDWDQVKVQVMTFAQQHKINTDPEFRQWLASTEGQYIYEWNNWSDLFWGISIYTGEGENVLGRIIMNLREIHFGGDVPF